MKESPVYQEIVEEARREGAINARREVILILLEAQFGAAAQALEVELKAVEFDRLRELIKFAAKCPDLPAFRERLLS